MATHPVELVQLRPLPHQVNLPWDASMLSRKRGSEVYSPTFNSVALPPVWNAPVHSSSPSTFTTRRFPLAVTVMRALAGVY